VGFLLAAVAGGVLAHGLVTRFGKRAGDLLGGLALAAGSVLVIIATHWEQFSSGRNRLSPGTDS
jgi:ABC-type branched-subunit amino acid transport system permease subunit